MVSSSVAVLLAFAFLCVANAQVDLCLNYSVVPGPVKAAVALGSDVLVLGFRASDLSQVVSVFEYIEGVLAAQTSNYIRNLNVGFSNNNFYQMLRCQYYTGEANCLNPNQYIYMFRNDEVYNESSPYFGLRVQFNSLEDVSTGNVAFATSYVTIQRPWYVKGATGFTGFTEPYAGATGGAWIRSYIDSSFYSLGGAIWSSDRLYKEPCAQCLQNINSFPTAVTLSNSLTNVVQQSPSNQRQAAASVLFSTLSQRNGFPSFDNTQQVYYGLASGSFYMAVDCNYAFATACELTSYRYVYGIADVINQYNLVFYDVNDDLVPIYDYVVYNDGPYATTQRPWYKVSDGWTDEYAYRSSDLVGRTYSAAFQTGVVGVDPLPSVISAQCNPVTPDLSSGHILTPIFSLVMVLFAIFA